MLTAFLSTYSLPQIRPVHLVFPLLLGCTALSCTYTAVPCPIRTCPGTQSENPADKAPTPSLHLTSTKEPGVPQRDPFRPLNHPVTVSPTVPKTAAPKQVQFQFPAAALRPRPSQQPSGPGFGAPVLPRQAPGPVVHGPGGTPHPGRGYPSQWQQDYRHRLPLPNHHPGGSGPWGGAAMKALFLALCFLLLPRLVLAAPPISLSVDRAPVRDVLQTLASLSGKASSQTRSCGRRFPWSSTSCPLRKLWT